MKMANKYLPPVKKRSLKKTLSYMSGNIVCKVCDFLNGLMTFIYMGGQIVLPEGSKDDWRVAILIVLGLIIWSVAWHFILTYIDENRRRYVNWMLDYTRKYYDYGEASEFETFVDASIKDNMIFRTRRLVVTKDIVLGCLDCEHKYEGFVPVAVMRKDVASDSFYEEERWYRRRNMEVHTTDGILELRMKNGDTIKLFVSEGRKNKIIRELLRGT